MVARQSRRGRGRVRPSRRGTRILATLPPDVGGTQSPAGRMNLTYAESVLAPDNETETKLSAAIKSTVAAWPIEHNRILLTYGTWLRHHKRAAPVTRLRTRSTRRL